MEEEKAKEQRKLEREQKRELREAEKKKKEEERKSKALEREKKKAQLEEPRKKKEAERSAKRKGKSKVTKVFVTRSKGRNCYSPQHSESGVNECTVCLWNYKDDLSEDGTPTRGWIQCTDNECSKWMHEDCILKDGDIMICVFS